MRNSYTSIEFSEVFQQRVLGKPCPNGPSCKHLDVDLKIKTHTHNQVPKSGNCLVFPSISSQLLCFFDVFRLPTVSTSTADQGMIYGRSPGLCSTCTSKCGYLWWPDRGADSTEVTGGRSSPRSDWRSPSYGPNHMWFPYFLPWFLGLLRDCQQTSRFNLN